MRRDSTWITRRISSSRPMTGSILPSRARAVRSTLYFSSAWNWLSGSCEVTRCDPRTSRNATRSSSEAMPILSFIASTRCSTERKSSFKSVRYLSAFASLLVSSRDIRGSLPPWAVGCRPTDSSARSRIIVDATPTLARSGATMVSVCDINATST